MCAAKGPQHVPHAYFIISTINEFLALFLIVQVRGKITTRDGFYARANRQQRKRKKEREERINEELRLRRNITTYDKKGIL